MGWILEKQGNGWGEVSESFSFNCGTSPAKIHLLA
jgi:hypothetical protein